MTTELKLHLACVAWPQMPDAELALLAASIKENGLREPITLTPDGLILDGRNRWIACERAGVAPQTVVYDGDDPIRFVLDKNRNRRHLSNAELSLIAVDLANLSHGGARRGARKISSPSEKNLKPVTQAEAAKRVGVGLKSVEEASSLRKHAGDHVVAIVKAGKVGLQTAAIAVRAGFSKAEQAQWTPADIMRIGQDRKNGASAPAPQAKKPRRLTMGEELEARSQRYGKFRPLSDEEAGKPPPEIAHEEDPDFPGIDRAYAHVLKHGRVQLWSPAETERLKLRGRFTELNVHIIALGRSECPLADDIDRLGPVDGLRVRRLWEKHLRAAHSRLSDYLAALDAKAPAEATG